MLLTQAFPLSTSFPVESWVDPLAWSRPGISPAVVVFAGKVNYVFTADVCFHPYLRDADDYFSFSLDIKGPVSRELT